MLLRRHRGHADAREHDHDHDHGGGTLLDRGWRYDAGVWIFDTFVMRGQIARLRRTVLDRAGLGPGSRLLDVGCGTGTLAIQAARRIGAGGQVAGIDPAPRQVARARAKTRRAGTDIDFRQATIEALPFPDGSFDAVTSTLMMHHLPGDVRERGLAEVQRVLRPGGRLVVADFDAAAGAGHGRGQAAAGGAHDLAAAVTRAGFPQPAVEQQDFDRVHHGWSGVTVMDALKP